MDTPASNTGPLGQPRGIGFAILMAIITLGIYTLYWVFKTQDEVKNHSGQGVGGVLGLVIYIVVSIVTWFLVPSEVGHTGPPRYGTSRRFGRDPGGRTTGPPPARGESASVVPA